MYHISKLKCILITIVMTLGLEYQFQLMATDVKHDNVKKLSNLLTSRFNAQSEDVVSTLTERRNAFQPYCSSLGDSRRRYFQTNFILFWKLSKSNIHNIYGKEAQLVWCPVFKAGTTNWYERFAELAGATKEEIDAPGQNIKKLTEKLTGSTPFTRGGLRLQDNSTVSFIVVRNPLIRLVSAFRDKMECKPGREFYFQTYGQNIVNRFRQQGVETFGSNYLSDMSSLHQSCRTEEMPTFWEFVQFVVSSPNADEHWTPASTLCNPCAFNFTYVIHFERLSQEEPAMLEDLGLHKMFPPIWENKHKGRPTSSYVTTYFKMLREEDWNKLLSIYSLDINLFGYKEQVDQLFQKVFKNF